MITISGKYKGKEYFHANRRVEFDRIGGGVGWPGEKPGSIVILGETEISNKMHRFVLAEAVCGSFGEILKDVAKLRRRLKVDSWHSRHVPGSEEYLSIYNAKAFKEGKPLFEFDDDAPDLNDKIQMNVELIRDNVVSGNKLLHFFNDSMLPSELQGLPEQTYRLTNLDYPAIAALGYILFHMEEFAIPAPYVRRPNAAY